MEYYETFDSGSSLTTLGWTEADAAGSTFNVAGVGRGGGYGMRNTPGVQGDAHKILQPQNPRMCLTFDWCREVVDSGLAYLVSMFRGYISGGGAHGDNNFGLGISGTTLILDSAEVGEFETIPNFWPVGDGTTWRTVRVEIQLSTYTAAGTAVPNGICRIWIGTTVGDLVQRYSRSDLLIADFRGFAADPSALPWSGLFFSPHGVIDNIYCTDYLCASQPNPPGGTCCGSTGPGGSSPDRPPTERNDTPRIIPPGGVLPSYTACTGGGAPATAADPSAAQSLIDATTPLIHIQISLPDATVLRYSNHPIPYVSGNGFTVTPRVTQWAEMKQTLADWYGSFEAMRTRVVLSDTDGTLRGYLASAANRHIDGREAIIWIESAANAAASIAPKALARGVIVNWRTTQNLEVEIEIMDPLGYRYSSVSLDRPIPQRVFRRELFPACPEHVLGKPVPIIYGEYSDDYVWNRDPARIPVGITPVWYVGRANTIPGLGNLPEDHWHAWVVSGHAIAGVQSWFASNDHPAGPASVRMDPGTEGVDWLIPFRSGYSARFATPYVDITGSDGITERFAMVFGRGPRADAAATGRVPLTLNICGLEDVGDGSGEVITDMAYQMQHFLCYWVLQNYKTGNWGAVPTFPGGTPKVKTSTFDTVRTTHNARVAGGYVGSWPILTQRPGRQHLVDAQIGHDIRLGIDHNGQVVAITLNDAAGTGGLTSFTASGTLADGTFDIDPRLDEIINVQEFEFGFEAGSGFMSGSMRKLTNGQSITDHGERPAKPLTFMTTHVEAVAADIAGRRLLRGSQPIPMVRFKVDLRGLSLSLGQLVNLTHYAGIGSSGWTTQTVSVTRIVTNPNEGDLLCTIEAEVVHDLLVANAAFGVLGDSGTGPVIGDSTTGFRLG